MFQPVDLPLVKLGTRVRFIFDELGPQLFFFRLASAFQWYIWWVLFVSDWWQFAGRYEPYRWSYRRRSREEPWPDLFAGMGLELDGIALLKRMCLCLVWNLATAQWLSTLQDYYTQEEKRCCSKKKDARSIFRLGLLLFFCFRSWCGPQVSRLR